MRAHVHFFLLVTLPGLAWAGEAPAPETRPWTLEEAKAELRMHPDDAFLQYAVVQLGRRGGTHTECLQWVNELRGGGANRRDEVDLFSLFSGALAVQEALQLDALRGREEVREKQLMIRLADLKGPTIESHPWKEMLGDRKPEISFLSQRVPADFWFAEFRSLNKLLDAIEVSDLWGTHVFKQATQEARTHLTGEHLKRQLVLETSGLLRPVYDAVVEEVAATGSDLYLREGSDVTLLFKVKRDGLFQARVNGFLANAQREHPEGKTEQGAYRGIAFVHFASKDRERCVYIADPMEGLHVRSNSKAAFERVLDAVLGATPEGHPVERLGRTLEFSYIRTLMPRGAPEEDGFIYLSDPFIRRVVGPAVKLTECRRLACYNHLKMIGYAALLFRTEKGRAPESLNELEAAHCAPGVFGEGSLRCPNGGTYALADGGTLGICSHHGHAHRLTPCLETNPEFVTEKESEEYAEFLRRYNQYWRRFFDPIALRVQITPKRYRMETIVLPLIDNTIYTGLAQVMSGKPEHLDAMPVPKRNIFTMALKVNKDPLLKGDEQTWGWFLPMMLLNAKEGVPPSLRAFVEKGIGSTISMNLYDAAPVFEINFTELLGQAAGNFGGSVSDDELFFAFVAASLNGPVYVSLPVEDPEIVDTFLAELDAYLAKLAREKEDELTWLPTKMDAYKVIAGGHALRTFAIRVGPLAYRLFWGRVGNGLHVSSRKEVLDDLIALEAAPKEDPGDAPDREDLAHGLVRVRPKNWNEILSHFRMGWAENNRRGCLDNLAPLSSVARAQPLPYAPWTEGLDARLGAQIHWAADRLCAVHHFCPEGGQYLVQPGGKGMACSVHGTAADPRQPAAPDENRSLGKLMGSLREMSARLFFTQEGLHAIVTIDRE